MKRTTLLLASLGLLLMQLVWAQTGKPNFTGKWTVETLDVESGVAPPPPPGGKQTIDVSHQEPNLKVDQLGYTTDGKESTNILRNVTIKSKAIWEGKRLIIVSQMELGDGPLKITETWELSADGKMLTIVKSFSGAAYSKVRMVCKMH